MTGLLALRKGLYRCATKFGVTEFLEHQPVRWFM